jgi:fucose permease
MGAVIFPAIIGMSSDLIGLRLALWVCPAISIIGVGIFIKLWTEKRNPLQNAKTI